MTCMQRSAPILGHGRGLQGQNRTPKMFSPDLGNERPCILPSAANPIQFRYILGKTHSQGSIHLFPTLPRMWAVFIRGLRMHLHAVHARAFRRQCPTRSLESMSERTDTGGR